MPIVYCNKCKEGFYAKPNWILRGHGKYCSVKCAGLSRRNGRKELCFICKKETYKSLKSIKRSKNHRFFCSKKCNTAWLSSHQFGENHVNWKNGEFAYKGIMERQKIEQICKLCRKDDSRFIIVHHIDKNRKNNQPTNLTWLCMNCHFLVHHYPIFDKKLSI